jgi:hypothetical protein
MPLVKILFILKQSENSSIKRRNMDLMQEDTHRISELFNTKRMN